MTPLDFFLCSLLTVLKWDQEDYSHEQSRSVLCYQVWGAEGSVLQSSLTQIHPLPFEEPQLRKEQGLGVRLIIKWLFYCPDKIPWRYLKLCSLTSCIVHNLPHVYKMYSLLLKPNTKTLFFFLSRFVPYGKHHRLGRKERLEDTKVENSI